MFFYILLFPEADFSTFFNWHFWHFATWSDSGFNRTFAIGFPVKCPLKQMGQNPIFCRFPDQTTTNFAPPFFSGEENQKSKTIVSVTDYCRTRWCKFGGSAHKQRRCTRSLYVGWEDFATWQIRRYIWETAQDSDIVTMGDYR